MYVDVVCGFEDVASIQLQLPAYRSHNRAVPLCRTLHVYI